MDCPYLNTVNVSLLDFDQEKLCRLSLAKTDVYCCLACGRYFQGRSACALSIPREIRRISGS